MLPPSNELRVAKNLIYIVAGLVLARVALDWALLAWSIPTRAFWVDELVNFTWSWAVSPHWYPHHLTWTFHTVSLLPLRWLPFDDPLTILILYRGFNWFALPVLVAPALWHAGRKLPPYSRLTIMAGGASLIWVWTTAAVARQNIWALAGLAWLFVDDWRTWRSWAGFGLSLLYPHATVFAVLFTWWRGHHVKIGAARWIAPAAAAFAVVPAAITIAIGLTDQRPLGASFNNRMPEALQSLPLPLPIPLDSPKWPIILTMLTATLLGLSLRRELKIQRVWVPVWCYLAFLALTGVVHVPPLLSRYLAPIVLFAWVWVAPYALRKTWRLAGRTRLLAALAALQAITILPFDIYWEAVPMPPKQAEAVASALDPCVIELGGSMIDILTSMDQLLAARLWKPANDNCEIRLAKSCHEAMMADYESRFHRLFSASGFSDRTPSIRFRPLNRGVQTCPLPPLLGHECMLRSEVAATEFLNPPPNVRAVCAAAQPQIAAP